MSILGKANSNAKLRRNTSETVLDDEESGKGISGLSSVEPKGQPHEKVGLRENPF